MAIVLLLAMVIVAALGKGNSAIIAVLIVLAKLLVFVHVVMMVIAVTRCYY